jgi:hypothetical protein
MDQSSVPKAANLDILTETAVPPSSTLRMRLVFANFLWQKTPFLFLGGVPGLNAASS